jgi:hypothetical protein
MSEALVARLRTVASGMGGFNAVTEAADRIEALERELLAAREDARRYQWLRAKVSGHRALGSARPASFAFPTSMGLPPLGDIMRGSVAQHMDAAIDSAMKGDGHG